MTDLPLASLPQAWAAYLDGATFTRQAIGMSGADVFRISRAGQQDVFLKSEPDSALSELPAEIERLHWLSAQGLPAPQVLETAKREGRHWLLMSAVPGNDLASVGDLAPEQLIKVLVQALTLLHRQPIEQCPFDHTLEVRLHAAKQRVEAGDVDASDFDEERQGETAEQLYEQLVSTRPTHAELVVAHSDACLPNFMMDGQGFSGFIDCGRLGVSDRYQDLALAARSIAFNLGEQWVGAFFDAYGVQPDAQRMAFYCLLDEFF